MPAFLEQALKKSAAKKGLSGKAAAKSFGGMNNMGAMKGSKMTPLGAAMQKKHQRDMKGM